MKNNKHIIIDLGSSHISVMATEILKSGAVHIISEESKKSSDIKYGVVAQASKAAFTIKELTQLLRNSARMPEIDKVCVSLNAKTMKQIPLYITRSIGFGKTVTENMLEDMMAECEKKIRHDEVDVFDIIPLSYTLDGKETDDPTGKKGNELIGRYNVIVGSIYIKAELNRCFERALPISLLNYTPLAVEALSTVLLDDEERERGCALINFGATTTTLATYSNGVLQQLLVVPLGGKNITKDIQELEISENDAERLKTLKGSALNNMVTNPVRIQIQKESNPTETVKIDTDFLATIIEARLTEIMAPIFKALEETDFPLDAGIIISGGGCKLNNIIEFLEEKTDIPVRYGDHSEWLSTETDPMYYDPIYAQSVGTSILINDYFEKNPEPEEVIVEPDKKKGLNNVKKKFTDKLADKFLKLFDDEPTK